MVVVNGVAGHRGCPPADIIGKENASFAAQAFVVRQLQQAFNMETATTNVTPFRGPCVIALATRRAPVRLRALILKGLEHTWQI